jgi:hypothetical protein
VAGLIAHVGILRKHHMENFEEVWDYYRQPEPIRKHQETTFLANFPDRVTRDQVDIKYIGVWDTVGSLGIPRSHFCLREYQFHDTTLAPGVEYAFQAAIRNAIADTVERLGTLDVAVVNTGVLRRALVEVFTLEDLDLMLNVNVRGVFLAIQASGCTTAAESSRSAATRRSGRAPREAASTP